jgi:hypothetical protein
VRFTGDEGERDAAQAMRAVAWVIANDHKTGADGAATVIRAANSPAPADAFFEKLAGTANEPDWSAQLGDDEPGPARDGIREYLSRFQSGLRSATSSFQEASAAHTGTDGPPASPDADPDIRRWILALEGLQERRAQAHAEQRRESLNELHSGKSWQAWEADGSDQRSVLWEIARHMANAWKWREKPGSTKFKAGYQLAHKGWKFGSGLVDLADGSATPGIKALRALIIAGRHDWFENAGGLAPGESRTALSVPSEKERLWLTSLCGPTTTLSRIELDGAEIWMVPESQGWRVAAVFVDDASASGLKQGLQLASATRSGCLSYLSTVVIGAISVTVVALLAGLMTA